MKILKYLMIFLVTVSLSTTTWAKRSTPTSTPSLTHAVFIEVNHYRRLHGLSPLVMSPLLNQEALIHSRRMAQHRIPFGHQGFDQRIKHIQREVLGYRAGAENVAYRYPSAKIVVDGWMHSSGHRRNILGHYHWTGIGIAYDKQGHPYYTQMFMRTE